MDIYTKHSSVKSLSMLCLVASMLVIAVEFTLPSMKRIFHLTSPDVHASVPTAVTLHYPTKEMEWDSRYILHNCIIARRVKHPMVVYTQNTSLPYCRACHCKLFTPLKCLPPYPNVRNLCEKLGLIAGLMQQWREMIYLDADLAVVKPAFFTMLTKRSRDWDFLAAYGEGKETPKYRGYFNSGLFYMRYLPTANYSDMLPFMYRIRNGNDQNIITYFVHDNYRRWDSLTRKWHCRRLLTYQMDTPPEACLTFHDRRELRLLSKQINFTLLTESNL